MDTFTVRDLREHTGQLIHDAEMGLRQALAIKLFQEEVFTLEKAAKLAGVSLETWIEILGRLGIPAVNYSKTELDKELKDFD